MDNQFNNKNVKENIKYDKYITEKKSTSDYRLQKFKKKYNYDPKNKTVEMDGQKVRFTYTGGSNKKNSCPDAGYSKKTGIDADKAVFNQKHPHTHDFILNHERGHLEYKKNKRKILKYDTTDKPITTVPKELQDVCKKLIRLSKNPNATEKEVDIAAKEFDNLTQKYKSKSEIDTDNLYSYINKINDLIIKNKIKTKHGQKVSEYVADDYARKKLGKHGKDIKNKAIKDEKRILYKNKNKIGDEGDTYKMVKNLSQQLGKTTKELNKTNFKNKRQLKHGMLSNNNDLSKIKKDLKKSQYLLDDAKSRRRKVRTIKNLMDETHRQQRKKFIKDNIHELDARKKINDELNKK